VGKYQYFEQDNGETILTWEGGTLRISTDVWQKRRNRRGSHSLDDIFDIIVRERHQYCHRCQTPSKQKAAAVFQQMIENIEPFLLDGCPLAQKLLDQMFQPVDGYADLFDTYVDRFESIYFSHVGLPRQSIGQAVREPTRRAFEEWSRPALPCQAYIDWPTIQAAKRCLNL
jgi:hypothetical protein